MLKNLVFTARFLPVMISLSILQRIWIILETILAHSVEITGGLHQQRTADYALHIEKIQKLKEIIPNV